MVHSAESKKRMDRKDKALDAFKGLLKAQTEDDRALTLSHYGLKLNKSGAFN